jgi:hypothetical protein
MLAIPLILLYELGIFLAGFITAYSRNPESAKSESDDVATAAAGDGSGDKPPVAAASSDKPQA